MASEITIWSTVPNDNGTLGTTPIYWPEGQAPSTVNNCARQMMAAIRSQWNDAQWFNWGYTVTKISGNQFQVVTASWNTVTIANVFQVGGRIKLLDTTTMYGSITEVSISASVTNVTFLPDAGSLTASFSSVYNSIITADQNSIPGGSVPADVVRQSGAQLYAADGGASDAYAISMSPTVTSLAIGQLINFKANTSNTGVATLNVDGLGAVTILKNNSQNLDTGDIAAGQIVTVIYDGTNFQMQSQVGNTTASSAGRLLSQQIFTSGSGTYTKPALVNTIVVECIGGGGGGGGTSSSAVTFGAGGGGGGGAYCRKTITSAAASYSYSVGTGGTGGAAGTNAGSSGTATTFGSLSAGYGTGGGGGSSLGAGTQLNGVPGGAVGATGGDLNLVGTTGGTGFSNNASGNIAIGGSGGDSGFGGGGATDNVLQAAGVQAGTSASANSGGGGSGGAALGAVPGAAGGNGGSGIIIVYEYS